MGTTERIEYLRGATSTTEMASHPVIELSEQELRMIVGGIIDMKGDANPTPTSKGTASYNSSGMACCDGTKVCCI